MNTWGLNDSQPVLDIFYGLLDLQTRSKWTSSSANPKLPRYPSPIVYCEDSRPYSTTVMMMHSKSSLCQDHHAATLSTKDSSSLTPCRVTRTVARQNPLFCLVANPDPIELPPSLLGVLISLSPPNCTCSLIVMIHFV